VVETWPRNAAAAPGNPLKFQQSPKRWYQMGYAPWTRHAVVESIRERSRMKVSVRTMGHRQTSAQRATTTDRIKSTSSTCRFVVRLEFNTSIPGQ
jgi:hypothetical protein